MEKVLRLTKKEFDDFLKFKKIIGDTSSESIVYKLDNHTILKDLKAEALYEFKSPDEMIYTENDLLKFSDVKSQYYYFVKKVIYVDDDLRACTMDMCNGFVLNVIDALSISLTTIIKSINRFYKETEKISCMGIKGYDMKSNFMYDGINFGAIDTIHYYFSDENEDDIYKSNISYFNDDVVTLLVDFYFMNFVKQNKLLNEMYKSIKSGELIDINGFITILRKELSEYCAKNIIYLSDAKDVVVENINTTEPFCPVYSLKETRINRMFSN